MLQNNSKIKPIGVFWKKNKSGYIVNDASFTKIQNKWKPIIEDVKNAYIKHLGKNLHSIYIKGSVARGRAIDNVSDLDTIAFVTLPDKDININWRIAFNKKIKRKYKFLTRVEIIVDPVEEIILNKLNRITLKTQSVCIYGDNLSKNITPMMPSENMTLHIDSIQKNIEFTLDYFKDKRTKKEVEDKCKSTMKKIVRSGFELVMKKSNKYTRDLYLCYSKFAKYYPKHKDKMRKVLELSIYPTNDIKIINHLLNEFKLFFSEKI